MFGVNGVAWAIFIVAFVIFLPIHYLKRLIFGDVPNGPLLAIGFFALMVALDVWTRLRDHEYRRIGDLFEDTEWLTTREEGGLAFFMPLWAVSLVCVIVNVVRLFTG